MFTPLERIINHNTVPPFLLISNKIHGALYSKGKSSKPGKNKLSAIKFRWQGRKKHSVIERAQAFRRALARKKAQFVSELKSESTPCCHCCWFKFMLNDATVPMCYLPKLSLISPCSSKSFLNFRTSGTRLLINRFAIKRDMSMCINVSKNV